MAPTVKLRSCRLGATDPAMLEVAPLKDWNDAFVNGVNARQLADAAWACGIGAVRDGADPDHGLEYSVAGVAGVASDGPHRGESAAPRTDAPLPLFPPMPQGNPYPIEALGNALSKAALAISRKVQVPPEMAAQSVLATATLAAQAHADLQMPFGQSRPCSLYFGTIAASGDRKTTADNEALRPIRRREKALNENYQREREQYDIAHAAWTGERRKIETNKKANFEMRKLELAALGPGPASPLSPFLTAPEPTVEGLIKAWVAAPPALGLFTAEGGQFIGGFGMTEEHKLKTAAAFSTMWDGQSIKRIRAGDGVVILEGRRLAAHLMVQPDAAERFFADPTLRDQGLLSRVLVAAPETIAGTRTYKATAPEDERTIEEYSDRLLALLERPWPLAVGTRNELAPRVLTMTPEAELVWRELYNEIEKRSAPTADLYQIRDFAAKTAEHAARMAAVITIIEDADSSRITIDAMIGAVSLARWYVDEALRLQVGFRTDPRLLRAHQLLEWMRARAEPEIDFRDILRLGPAPIRTKVAAEEVLLTLITHGWVREVCTRPRRVSVVADENSR
jgi:hypothetical protein